MPETAPPPPLAPDAAGHLAEFARACKAAARAVSLYPGSASRHRRLAVAARAGDDEADRRRARSRSRFVSNRLLLDGALSPAPDPAIAELADLLHRHLDRRADGQRRRRRRVLAHAAPAAGAQPGGSPRRRRHRQAVGDGRRTEPRDRRDRLRRGAAREAGARRDHRPDHRGGDRGPAAPARRCGDAGAPRHRRRSGQARAADARSSRAATARSPQGVERPDGGPPQHPPRPGRVRRPHQPGAARHHASKQFGTRRAAPVGSRRCSRCSAQRKRPEAMAGTSTWSSAIIERMSDGSVAALRRRLGRRRARRRPNGSPTRSRPSCPSSTGSASCWRSRETGGRARPSSAQQAEQFKELWRGVEKMLTSYTDARSSRTTTRASCRSARTRAVDVERIERRPAGADRGLAGDGQRRGPAQPRSAPAHRPAARSRTTRRAGATSPTDGRHARRRPRARRPLRSGAGCSPKRSIGRAHPSHRPNASRTPRAALERFAPRLDDEARRGAPARGRATRRTSGSSALCHAIGTVDHRAARRSALGRAGRAVAPAAARHPGRVRRRRAREAVQPLMNAPNWEVRRTAAFLLREFGGAEGLKELVPLLTDTEPLVQREAIQGLMLNGTRRSGRDPAERADERQRAGRARRCSARCWRCATSAPRRSSATSSGTLNRGRFPQLYLGAIEALGSFGGAGRGRGPEGRRCTQGDWWAPLRTRRTARRGGDALRRIGTPQAHRRPARSVRHAAPARARGPPRAPSWPEHRDGSGSAIQVMNRCPRRLPPLALYDDLLRRFASGVRAAQLYAADHPLLGRNVEGLLAALKALHAAPAVDHRRHRRQRVRRRRHAAAESQRRHDAS